MWDSGVRKELKKAARAVGCDFAGFGLHAFRRANITMRQEEGGSAIEAAKSRPRDSEPDRRLHVVQLKRQDELTRLFRSEFPKRGRPCGERRKWMFAKSQRRTRREHNWRPLSSGVTVSSDLPEERLSGTVNTSWRFRFIHKIPTAACR